MKDHNAVGVQWFHAEEMKDVRYSLSEPIDLNSASDAELRRLRGLGVSYAARIVERRPYRNLETLMTKTRIPSYVLERIRGQITLE